MPASTALLGASRDNCFAALLRLDEPVLDSMGVDTTMERSRQSGTKTSKRRLVSTSCHLSDASIVYAYTSLDLAHIFAIKLNS
jgi:hypothetical protein